VINGDMGRTLCHIIEDELGDRSIVSTDGIQWRAFDYVDIGEVIQPGDVVPMVIKSLLFSPLLRSRHFKQTGDGL
jgi:ethanolamine utilization protein EutA (predicted chaperonin)